MAAFFIFVKKVAARRAFVGGLISYQLEGNILSKILIKLGWLLVVILTTFLFAFIALKSGETINAVWLVICSFLTLLIGYRFYSLYIAKKILSLNSSAITPAHYRNDGLDYVPTNKFILFGHHFAAIAGAGPLVGPVLAVQMGYLPGLLWILVGCVLAGAVQDFIILVISLRNDGKSLGELLKSELGFYPGLIGLISTFMIMIIILGVLSLVVLRALSNSPWSFFTVAATIPIGLFMGIYLRYIRPARVFEVSMIGFFLLFFAIIGGRYVAESSSLAPWFTYTAPQMVFMLVAYGFTAAALPVWLLLAPRDYLSTFLKIGVIFALAIATIIIAPQIKMPAITKFASGGGPVWSGSLFPFLFITIACGAVSGFHSLIATGTTPKMIANEEDARFIGYGAMLLEGFVAVIALIVASCLQPGIYFAINSPSAFIGNNVENAASVISSWGFVLTPETLTNMANLIGEHTILSRTGGAPTLAVGIAQIFSQVFNDTKMLAFWYHFAILFEALFILTAVDAGTRAGRFILQDLIGTFFSSIKHTESWLSNIMATGLCVLAWGYFLYQGVIDPLGGINSLWPLFGISNQMLAGIALTLATIYLLRNNQTKHAW